MPNSMQHPLRVFSLDVLRFIAAFLVVFGHIHIAVIEVKNTWAQWAFFEMRAAGMTLFFILSGFVIALNYPVLGVKGCPIKKYAIHRFSRIYPLFLLIFIYEAIFESKILATLPAAEVRQIFFSYLSLTHAWFYSQVEHTIFAILVFGVSWSLSVEFFFYLVYPFVEMSLKNLGIQHFKACLLIVLSLFFVLLVLVYQLTLPAVNQEYLNFDASDIRWFVYFSPYLSVFEFIMGCLLARIYLSASPDLSAVELKYRQWFLLLAVLGPVLLYAVFVWRAHQTPSHSYEAFYVLSRGLSPFLAYIVYYMARYVRINRRHLAVLMGDISYPMYLVHWTFFLNMFDTLVWQSWLLYVLAIGYMLVFLLFFSYGILVCYDRPIRTACRQGLSRLFSVQ